MTARLSNVAADEVASRPARPAFDEAQLRRRVEEIADRHPAVGLAVAQISAGHLDFVCRGHAEVASRAPVTPRTSFRIASITKTMTAIAVMQLWEERRIDLDAPVNTVLRTYRLVPRDPSFGQPTIRQLLTHTAGIPDARHLRDLVHVGWGAWDARPPIFSVPFGDELPSLGEYYRHGLEVVAQPGSAFAYSNPTFATLGQIVEDVSGQPLDEYFRHRIFEPLGMTHSDLRRTPAVTAQLATGYTIGRGGPRAVPDRDWIGAGGGGVYATLTDLAAYADALLHGGANAHGRVLRPGTLALMFEKQFENWPGMAAIGLGFFRTDADGHRVVSHDGVLPGFNAHLAVAPDDGVAIIALTNGSPGAMRWLPAEMDALLRDLLGLRVHPAALAPHHPEVWPEICGRYLLPEPGDLRGRVALGGGLEVFVARGRPMIRVRIPVPAAWRGLPLQPADPHDPHAFRLDLSGLGMSQVRLRFARDPVSGRRLMHTDLGGQPISFSEPGAAPAPRRRVDRLGTEERLMLRMSRAWPQDIGCLVILEGSELFPEDGRFRIDAVRDHIASRLHLAPRLRQVVRTPSPGRGGPYWADAPAFDLVRHVQEVRLTPSAGEPELLAAVESLRALRFERRHPLWGIWFLTGMADRKVAMFIKLHHSIGDGLAAMTIVSALLDFNAVRPGGLAPTWVPRPAPRPSELVADNLWRRLRALERVIGVVVRPWVALRTLRDEWPAVRELLAERPGDRTSIDRIVGDGRRLALVRAPYRTVRRVGRRSGASVNDVLLASTAAGISRLLAGRGEPVHGVTVRSYVPVSLRHRLRGPQQGNLIAQMAVPLALDPMPALDRLQAVAAETRRRKARLRPALGSIFRGRLMEKLLLKLVIAQRVNVTTASIPGPRQPAHFAGARVLEAYPVLPLVGNEPIGVGAVSYAGAFTLGIAVDRDAVPDLDALAAGVRGELAALAGGS